METKQDKIIALVTGLLAVIILIAVIACNVGNDSSKQEVDNVTMEADTSTESETVKLEASLSEKQDILVGIPGLNEEVKIPSIAGSSNSETETKTETETEVEVETENETEDEVADHKYKDKFLVLVNTFVNVRTNPSVYSDVAGKIYNGGGGDIIEIGPEWTKIKSGNLEGYISNKYIIVGYRIEGLESEFAVCKAKALADSLRVRKTASKSGSILCSVNNGDMMEIIELGETWTKVSVDGYVGYVATEYIELVYEMGTGVTVAEEQAAIEAQKEKERLEKEAEERRKEEEKRRQEEEQRRKEEEKRRQEEEAKKIIENSKFVETIKTSPYNISAEDAYLIACVVNAEAGDDVYEDQLAVANVILNRLRDGRFGKTVYDIIYAKNQFAVTRNGMLNKVIKHGPSEVSIQATKDAISGINNVPDYLFFCSLRSAKYSQYSQYTIISLQVFYKLK